MQLNRNSKVKRMKAQFSVALQYYLLEAIILNQFSSQFRFNQYVCTSVSV